MSEPLHFECSFLIPILRNSNRKPHQPLAWRLLTNALNSKFGGQTGPQRTFLYRSMELVPGEWVPDGQVEPIEDESRLYRVSVAEDKVDELRSILRKAGNTFDQRSIYLCVR